MNNTVSEKCKVLISLGSNDGNREENIENAIKLFSETDAIDDVFVSSYYETEPVGIAYQPWFLNVVISGKTSMPLMNLIQLCKSIEYAMGRKLGVRWGQRNIDLDILLYGNSLIDMEQLTVPHPRMHERKFVLVPAAEIAGEQIHPGFGLTIKELLDSCSDTSVVKEKISI